MSGRLCIAPTVSVVRDGDDGVMLSAGFEVIRLEGEHVALFVGRILPLLDGASDADAVAERLAGFDPQSVRGFLSSLQDLGFVQEAPDGRFPPREPFDPRVANVRPASQPSAPASAPPRLAAARVLVLGSGRWAEACASDLAGLGVGRVVVRDRPVDLAAGWDLAVAAFDAGDGGASARTSARLVEEGVTSVWGGLEGEHAVVAPPLRPGRPGCWCCVRARALANRDPDSVRFALASPDAVVVRASVAHHPPSALELLARLLAGAALDPLTGARSDLVVRRRHLASGDERLHPFVPVPGCPVCGGPAPLGPADGIDPPGPAERTAARLEPGELRARLDRWIDPWIGVVRSVEVVDGEACPGPPVTAVARGGSVLRDRSVYEPGLARGVGRTGTEAQDAALAEALERYAAAVRQARTPGSAGPETAIGTWRELGDSALEPRLLAGCWATPADRAIAWARGTWLGGGAVWVPAAAVYLGTEHEVVDGSPPATSNGLAAGVGFAEAALRAAYELIERDAVLVAWHRRRAGSILAVEDGPVARMAEALAACGVRLELSSLDAALPVPAVLAVAFGDGERWPAAVVGAASGPNLADTALRAAAEAASNCRSLSREMRELRERGAPGPSLPSAVRTIDDHARFWAFATGEALDRFPPSDTAEAAVGSGGRSGPASLPALAALARAHGIRVALADVTSSDMAGTPLRVVRAVSPDLVPLWFGVGATPKHPRLAPPGNPLPHPFA